MTLAELSALVAEIARKQGVTEEQVWSRTLAAWDRVARRRP
jgi:hypothetical protein